MTEVNHPVSATSVTSEPVDDGDPCADLARCLQPMIKQSSADDQEAITPVELEDMTQHAAAKRLGLLISGMKSRMQRGRRQLENMLEACGEMHLDGRRGIADDQVRDPKSDPCGCSALSPDT